MIESFSFLSELYEDIYCWITSITPGEYVTKKYFVNKDKKIWNKIRNKFIELEIKKELTNIEKDFLKCKYVGKSFRIIKYNGCKNGYVYPINCYQSCSKSLEGIKNVKLNGDVILIELFSLSQSYSIDLFKILEFMLKNKLVIYKDEFDINHRNILNLEKYYNEEEVLVILSEDNIKNVSIYNYQKKIYKVIDRDKWFRNNMR